MSLVHIQSVDQCMPGFGVMLRNQYQYIGLRSFTLYKDVSLLGKYRYFQPSLSPVLRYGSEEQFGGVFFYFSEYIAYLIGVQVCLFRHLLWTVIFSADLRGHSVDSPYWHLWSWLNWLVSENASMQKWFCDDWAITHWLKHRYGFKHKVLFPSSITSQMTGRSCRADSASQIQLKRWYSWVDLLWWCLHQVTCWMT